MGPISTASPGASSTLSQPNVGIPNAPTFEYKSAYTGESIKYEAK